MNDVDTRITLARRWVALRVPFLHLGRDRNGSDCIGLLVYSIGHDEKDVPAYSRDPHHGLLERELERVFGPPVVTAGREGVQAEQLRVGDVVAMAYGRGNPRHVGFIAEHPVYAGHLSMIHTDAMVGEVTEHSIDDHWLARIRKVHR